MAYFTTRGIVTARFPITFNSDDALATNTNTSVLHTTSIANGIYNDFTRVLSGLSVTTLIYAGKFFKATSGSRILVPASHKIVSNNGSSFLFSETLNSESTGLQDTSQTNVAGTVQFGAFGQNDVCVLRGLNVLVAATLADVVTLVDRNGTAFMTFTVPATVVSAPPFNLNGIQTPAGGFGVTTTQIASIYQFLFDVFPSTT
jgi:hypothetical protein